MIFGSGLCRPHERGFMTAFESRTNQCFAHTRWLRRHTVSECCGSSYVTGNTHDREPTSPATRSVMITCMQFAYMNLADCSAIDSHCAQTSFPTVRCSFPREWEHIHHNHNSDDSAADHSGTDALWSRRRHASKWKPRAHPVPASQVDRENGGDRDEERRIGAVLHSKTRLLTQSASGSRGTTRAALAPMASLKTTALPVSQEPSTPSAALAGWLTDSLLTHLRKCAARSNPDDVRRSGYAAEQRDPC